MSRHQSVTFSAFALLITASVSAIAQGTGPMRMRGAMQDSATAAQMQVIHELVMNNDRITRTVTNLPNGVRTLTESSDPRLATLIQEHVRTMNQRVHAGDDPGMPMESAALHAIFRGKDRILTKTALTPTGVSVEQTSSDSSLVVALQQHATELTDLVKRGMTAMHEAMMRGGQGSPMHAAAADTGFAAMQERGKQAMGVDQYTSTHQFEMLADGGRIELQRDVDDSAGVAEIRAHLKGIVAAFSAGDFNTPAFVHMRDVPGAKVMAAKRSVITYVFRELPGGGEVRITSKDPDAILAIHQFLAFQQREHHSK